MTNKNYGAAIAQQKDAIEGTWEVDGETYDLLTEDTTKETLDLIERYMQVVNQVANAESEDDIPDDLGDDLPNFPWEESGDEKDIIESVIDEKLIKPEIDVQQTPVRKLRALFEGMYETWNEGSKVKDAKAEMPLDKGNG